MAERCRAYAVDYRVLDADGVIRLEPALAPIETALAGGIHFPADVAGDAHLFCRVLAARAADAGVRFRFESEVRRVHLRQGRFHALEHDGLVESADACVIAAGASSPRLLRPLGIALPVQPVKGYSLTVPFDSWTPRPRVPVIDEHFHAAACPLGAALRIAGTAEFAGFDTTLNPARLENLYRLLAHLYPEGAARVERRDVVHWSGLRPMSPDGVGIMGQTAVTGLYVNTGHGHLGWTMAPGAGKLVAQQVPASTPIRRRGLRPGPLPVRERR